MKKIRNIFVAVACLVGIVVSVSNPANAAGSQGPRAKTGVSTFAGSMGPR